MCQHDRQSTRARCDRDTHELCRETVCKGCGKVIRRTAIVSGYRPLFRMFDPAVPSKAPAGSIVL